MYTPDPIDTTAVELPAQLEPLIEQLARHNHDVWSRRRMAEGWQLGERRDDASKTHPCLVPYDELPESEKEYDRCTSLEALKAIVALGYRLEPPGCAAATKSGTQY